MLREGNRIMTMNKGMKRLTFLVVGLLIISFTSYAGDDIYCARYAKTAVEQYESFMEKGCGEPSARWSGDYNHHYQWCLRVDTETANAEALARARALQDCGANPVSDVRMSVEVRFESIEVVDEADGSGNAEPYLLTMFFKIDQDTFDYLETDTSKWSYVPVATHENLGTNGGDGWDAGHVIPIPESVGLWRTTLRSGDVPEDQTGVIALAILLEEDVAPSTETIRNYNPQIAEIGRSILIDNLKKVPAHAWSIAGNSNLLKAATKKAQDEMIFRLSKENAIQQSVDFSDRAWITLTLPGILELISQFVDLDDFIGMTAKYWNWTELEAGSAEPLVVSWDESTGSEDGSFIIRGRVSGGVVAN